MNGNLPTSCGEIEVLLEAKQIGEKSRKVEMESYLNLLEDSFPGIKNNIVRCESLGFKWAGEGRIFVKLDFGHLKVKRYNRKLWMKG